MSPKDNLILNLMDKLERLTAENARLREALDELREDTVSYACQLELASKPRE